MKLPPFIDIHTHKLNSGMSDLTEIVNLLPDQMSKIQANQNLLFSVGIHPWYIHPDKIEEDFSTLKMAVQNKNVIAVGEAGLDRLCSVSMDLQKAVFNQQLRLAESSQKPLIVHSVRTYPDVVELFKIDKVEVKLIFHGFTGNQQIAGQLVKRGFYLSFGAALMDKRRHSARVFENVPYENIFLETDESTISIAEIYKTAAELKGTSVEDLKQVIHQNFVNCFIKTI